MHSTVQVMGFCVGVILLLNKYNALGQSKMLINLKSEYFLKKIGSFLGDNPFVHNYWAAISVQNYYATK